MANRVFVLGWRPLGARKRRWQVQCCPGVADATRIVAGLARGDGGGRWRVYGTVSVLGPAGSVRVVRGGVLAEGVERPWRTAC